VLDQGLDPVRCQGEAVPVEYDPPDRHLPVGRRQAGEVQGISAGDVDRTLVRVGIHDPIQPRGITERPRELRIVHNKWRRHTERVLAGLEALQRRAKARATGPTKGRHYRSGAGRRETFWRLRRLNLERGPLASLRTRRARTLFLARQQSIPCALEDNNFLVSEGTLRAKAPE
jgi:hypothetical protein